MRDKNFSVFFYFAVRKEYGEGTIRKYIQSLYATLFWTFRNVRHILLSYCVRFYFFTACMELFKMFSTEALGKANDKCKYSNSYIFCTPAKCCKVC